MDQDAECFGGGADDGEGCVETPSGVFLEEIHDRQCRGKTVHEVCGHGICRCEVRLVVAFEIELPVGCIHRHIMSFVGRDTGAGEDIVEDLFGRFILGEGDVESGRTVFGFGCDFPPVPEPAVTFRVILAVLGEFKVELFRVDGHVHFGAYELDREALRQSVFPHGDVVGFDEDVSTIDVLVGNIGEAGIAVFLAEAECTVGFESGRFGIAFDPDHGFEDEILQGDFAFGETPDDFIADIFDGCVDAEMCLQAEQDGFLETADAVAGGANVGTGGTHLIGIDGSEECVGEVVEFSPVLIHCILFIFGEEVDRFCDVERMVTFILGGRFDPPDGVFADVFHEFLIGCFAADEDETIIERHGDVAVEGAVFAFVSFKSSVEILGHFDFPFVVLSGVIRPVDIDDILTKREVIRQPWLHDFSVFLFQFIEIFICLMEQAGLFAAGDIHQHIIVVGKIQRIGDIFCLEGFRRTIERRHVDQVFDVVFQRIYDEIRIVDFFDVFGRQQVMFDGVNRIMLFEYSTNVIGQVAGDLVLFHRDQFCSQIIDQQASLLLNGVFSHHSVSLLCVGLSAVHSVVKQGEDVIFFLDGFQKPVTLEWVRAFHVNTRRGIGCNVDFAKRNICFVQVFDHAGHRYRDSNAVCFGSLHGSLFGKNDLKFCRGKILMWFFGEFFCDFIFGKMEQRFDVVSAGFLGQFCQAEFIQQIHHDRKIIVGCGESVEARFTEEVIADFIFYFFGAFMGERDAFYIPCIRRAVEGDIIRFKSISGQIIFHIIHRLVHARDGAVHHGLFESDELWFVIRFGVFIVFKDSIAILNVKADGIADEFFNRSVCSTGVGFVFYADDFSGIEIAGRNGDFVVRFFFEEVDRMSGGIVFDGAGKLERSISAQVEGFFFCEHEIHQNCGKDTPSFIRRGGISAPPFFFLYFSLIL